MRLRRNICSKQDELVRYGYAPDHVLKVLGKAIGWVTAYVPKVLTTEGGVMDVPAV